jgi:hypothetical protein
MLLMVLSSLFLTCPSAPAEMFEKVARRKFRSRCICARSFVTVCSFSLRMLGWEAFENARASAELANFPAT